MKESISHAIARIRRMEELFDAARNVWQNAPEELHSPSMQETVQTLSDYYANGGWQHDYELDEQHLLPRELKRGVLSQDGLYDLLSSTSTITPNAAERERM